MRVLIIGAAGMLGQKLVAALAAFRSIGLQRVTALTLADVVEPKYPGDLPVDALAADLSAADVPDRLLRDRPEVIFHLAAVVSGEAEENLAKGYRVNLDGTRLLFEAIARIGKAENYVPRLVYTSSIAVFGGPFPETIDDTFAATPHTSYGTQKAVGELLLNDYSRRGYLDGVGIRLPTIAIRPGKPNRAASSFFSSIVREPLAGEEAILPVSDETRHWFASPRAAVGFMLHAAALDGSALGGRRTLNMPGVCATVREQIEALRRVAGESALRLIRRQYDPAIASIIASWPERFAPERAIGLGFRCEQSFDEIIQAHIEDQLASHQVVAV